MIGEKYDALTAVGGWGILAAASRSILSEDRRSIIGFLRGLVLAIFVGIIVGLVIQDYGFTAPTQSAVVGISSFIADDILLMILAVSSAVCKDPREAFLNFIQYVFGRSK